ncbi:MAG: hypothetical protein DRR08_01135 [Candidatus Parabeggiatoa sp. nov. 2]|nr:MAG: hypothetical protein B6247_03135 [Beggiatoa sp. 4572_84]RKZ64315.1 MAG: hypothetical protein DRR08_01135 [Gammaproteobacteria bacterium]
MVTPESKLESKIYLGQGFVIKKDKTTTGVQDLSWQESKIYLDRSPIFSCVFHSYHPFLGWYLYSRVFSTFRCAFSTETVPVSKKEGVKKNLNIEYNSLQYL